MMENIVGNFYCNYEWYFEKSFYHRYFDHKEIKNLILYRLPQNDIFTVTEVGRSVEDREIYLVKVGSGKTKVLLWSQMHGDEPTSTAAFFDFFGFLLKNDKWNDVRGDLLRSLTLYFVPMLNPDGVERFSRYNAQGIDLNRDAKALVAPESRILDRLVNDIKPDFAFNMHDQDFRWSVGGGKQMVTLSFLAPAFDEARTVDEPRRKAISLLSTVIRDFDEICPGRITRYSDDFEPRSFGDTIAGKGISTILIESGRYEMFDSDKRRVRQILPAILFHCFLKISNNDFEDDGTLYNNTPFNGKFLYDLIMRNVKFTRNGVSAIADFAINRNFHFNPENRKPYFISNLEAVGDLSPFFGYYEADCTGLEIMPYDKYPDLYELKEIIADHPKLQPVYPGSSDFRGFPHPGEIQLSDDFPAINRRADFFLTDGNNVRFIVLNGRMLSYPHIKRMKDISI
ncbi:MAG: hypothetical protein K9I69_01845 [Ignavibacteriales bacterium]|nr:hypothetical protein [Ignavibacteriales bacterium]MCF8305882.1 hypothetical protein [Ignavibacteriales bacterium]MCF8315603.1 hypothetical protein [Ignavibacteriales bacterium]MCF8437203.1 hypothetical protein [Ignavibacteriales bacterium]